MASSDAGFVRRVPAFAASSQFDEPRVHAELSVELLPIPGPRCALRDPDEPAACIGNLQSFYNGHHGWAT